MDVPNYLTKQFYVQGSLRNRSDGFELQARNRLGDGVLVGVGALAVDDRPVPKEAVSAQRDDDSGIVRAVDVTRFAPIRAPKGTAITLFVTGPQLAAGQHTLSVELYEVNLGLLRLSITDFLASG